MTTDTDRFDLKSAPMRIGRVRLKVRDLAQVTDFYTNVLGLNRIAKSADGATLGAGATPLLELVSDPALAPRNPRDAGLFHTAFLLPARADLARWLAFASENRIQLHGASNHIVSEALYLADPEGNGIEIYADRPVSEWRAASGEIHMATEPLDAQDLLDAAGGARWNGFPSDGVIGHVHLQVGDTELAEGFYRDTLGFDVASRYPGASFFGSGGYHHQLAGNVWRSRGAGPRPERMAGLDSVEILVRDAAQLARISERAGRAGETDADDALTLRDPWGTALTLSHRGVA